MILPTAEVADVARPSQARRPSLIGVHHRVVQLDWKQDCLAGFVLLFERRLHFFLYPPARDGMLRQDHHQLVVQANRLVDARAELVTDLQVLGRKPAADGSSLAVRGLPVGFLAMQHALNGQSVQLIGKADAIVTRGGGIRPAFPGVALHRLARLSQAVQGGKNTHGCVTIQAPDVGAGRGREHNSLHLDSAVVLRS